MNLVRDWTQTPHTNRPQVRGSADAVRATGMASMTGAWRNAGPAPRKP